MKKWIVLMAGVLFLGIFTPVWANEIQEVRAVLEGWFNAMKHQQVNTAASFLAPQFVSIHTDGVVRDRKQEVQLIRYLHMKDYHLSDFKFSRSDNTMVVTFKDQGSEQIDNKPIDTTAAGRMAVLQKKGTKWTILAYANLDAIG
jgi:hypothetical protein